MKKIPLTEEEIRNKLTPEEYSVLRERGTEPPFSGKLLQDKRDGTYVCKVCGNKLFESTSKFDSNTGWPSFDRAIKGSVEEVLDLSSGMSRTEIVCSQCHSHLGHVFSDGPTETKMRYCLNSVCLDLEEKIKIVYNI